MKQVSWNLLWIISSVCADKKVVLHCNASKSRTPRRVGVVMEGTFQGLGSYDFKGLNSYLRKKRGGGG
jgi:hypothetical protein